jgi:hypothetical protein
MAREDYSRDYRSIAKGEALRKALAPALRPASVTQRRTKYDGPVKNRGEDARGNANVSREELADFQRQYGADKTLRDLLNADATGKLPARVGAGAGRGAAEGRKATDRDTAPMRASSGPAAPYRDKAAEAKREADTTAVLERMRARPPMESNEAARDRYKENTLNALTGLGTVAGGPLASRLGAALARRGVKETPALTEEVVRQGRDIPFKKGGNVKSYAKGGSVRGAGCETRSKKTRYV